MDIARRHPLLTDTVRLLKALSDATRLRLLRLLAAGELNVAELCEVLALPQPTVSRHLGVLRETGLIADRRDGPRVFYALAAGGLEPAVRPAWDALATAIAEGPDARRDRERLSRVLKRRREAGHRFFEKGSAAARGTRQSRFGDLVSWRTAAGLLPREGLLVDLGTGAGDLLPYLARRAGRVLALDFSARMLVLARARARAEGLDNVAFVQGELESAPLPAAAADGVVASLVLHHAARPAEAVREMARLLAPGGRAVLVDFLPHREEWLREEEGDAWLGFEPAAVRAWFEKAGFMEIVIEEGPPPLNSGRRDRPGADRRLRRLRLLWVEAVRGKGTTSPSRKPMRGVRHGAGKVQRG